MKSIVSCLCHHHNSFRCSRFAVYVGLPALPLPHRHLQRLCLAILPANPIFYEVMPQQTAVDGSGVALHNPPIAAADSMAPCLIKHFAPRYLYVSVVGTMVVSYMPHFDLLHSLSVVLDR